MLMSRHAYATAIIPQCFPQSKAAMGWLHAENVNCLGVFEKKKKKLIGKVVRHP